jgi:hypothetical protein
MHRSITHWFHIRKNLVMVVALVLCACGSGGSNDAGSDAGMNDGGGDGGGTGRDGGCTAVSGPDFLCGGLITCNGTTSYCVGGAVRNACMPIPGECLVCAEAHNCACLLSHAPSPCDGGTVRCTEYADGGELWLFVTNCQ